MVLANSQRTQGLTTTSMSVRDDPILFEVLKNRLLNIAEEMALTLRQTAYSPNLRTRGDLTSVIFDAGRSSVVQATRYAPPVHAGTVAAIVPRALAWYERHQSRDPLGLGDMLCINDPFIGGTHKPDTTLIMPYFFQDTLVGYVVNVVHHTDIGGRGRGGLAPDASDCFEEGFNIPPVKLVRNGQIDSQLLTIFCGNSRVPDDFAGDVRAQVAANITGGRRLNALINRYGAEAIQECMQLTLDYAENRMQDLIAQLPTGIFEREMHFDPDACSGNLPIVLHVTATHTGKRLHLDFTSSSAQVPGPRNATWPNTITAILYVLKALVPPEVPLNAGLLRAIDLTIPTASVLNAQPPVPTSLCWDITAALVELLIATFGTMMPDRAVAASKGFVANYGFSGNIPETGKSFVWYESLGGGVGACSWHDGIDGAQIHIQAGSPDVPAEELEMVVPVRQTRLQLRPDSGGAGKHRGGLGLAREYQFLYDTQFSVIRFSPSWCPPGINGGKPGARGRHVVDAGSPAEYEVESSGIVHLKAGQRMLIETPGGGGYGNPRDRALQSVLADIANGKLSHAAAERDYGINSGEPPSVLMHPPQESVEPHADITRRDEGH